MTQVTVNGNTYSDDGSTPKDMQSGGFRENLLPMVSDTMTDTAAKVAAAANQASIATAQANIAIGAAASTVTGPGSTGTSTTSLTVGLGSKSLTIQTGKTLYPGMPIVVAATATPQDAMYGPLISYNSGTGAMVVQVTNINTTTAGTYITAAAWTVSLSGPAGVTGVLNEFKAAPIATASTVNLDSATGNLVHLTGSTTITAITLASGAERSCVLDAAPLLTNGANLICPGGANIQGAAGDCFVVRGEGSSVARIVSYTKANGDSNVRYLAPYLHVREEQTSGTNGGTGSTGFNTRTLNTVVGSNTISGASLASNIVTLPAGTYDFEALAPTATTQITKLSLYNNTDSVDILVGESLSSGASGSASFSTHCAGRFTLASSKGVKLRHWLGTSGGTYDLGSPTGNGQVEVYASLKLWKVA
jgi:hypothetical protein